MNEDVITDFKQFITATVSQLTFDLREDLQSLRGDMRKIDNKVDDLSHFVAEAIETTNEATDRQFKNHERRIKKLERKPA